VVAFRAPVSFNNGFEFLISKVKVEAFASSNAAYLRWRVYQKGVVSLRGSPRSLLLFISLFKL
jgi:hypothetical protein